jgi:sugar O-acyltransferase (sialic acid O-acetyltransferase NeuD family)
LIGSSGHAKVVIDIVEKENKYRIVGLIDRFRQIGEETLGYTVIGKEEDLPRLVHEYAVAGGLVAIGDNFQRSEVVHKINRLSPDFPFSSSIHPQANIARDVEIGTGTVIMAGVTISPSCTIGRFCLLNTNSSLDHDSVMDEFSSLAPRVSTGGNVHVGAFSAVGIGATLVHRVRIGEHTVIGAGATVLNDIASFKVAYGTPAIAIRGRSIGDKYL